MLPVFILLIVAIVLSAFFIFKEQLKGLILSTIKDTKEAIDDITNEEKPNK